MVWYLFLIFYRDAFFFFSLCLILYNIYCYHTYIPFIKGNETSYKINGVRYYIMEFEENVSFEYEFHVVTLSPCLFPAFKHVFLNQMCGGGRNENINRILEKAVFRWHYFTRNIYYSGEEPYWEESRVHTLCNFGETRILHQYVQ